MIAAPGRLPAPAIPILAGVAPLAERYDGFILDVWGVLHDGMRPYPGAIDTMKRLAGLGKRVIALSNAPRPAEQVEARLEELGFPRDAYRGAMTSGEDVWRHLKRRDDPWYAGLGPRCFFLGPMKDEAMLAGIGGVRARDVESADYVINTGVAFGESVDTVLPELEAAARLKLPMICANPDLVVVYNGKREICAGALAKRYEELGGAVRYHGKPFPGIYDECLSMLGLADRGRVVAIGDGLHTDIAGARAAKLGGAVLVTGGINAETLGIAHGDAPDPALLAQICLEAGMLPDAALPALRW
jgi:HAD superfamily hydrolase (TIGR01459 family)